MTASDVECQKVLESYGCKFLRLNRFDTGSNPAETLSQRLEKLVNTEDVKVRAVALDVMSSKVKQLQDKIAKECEKCKKVNELQVFFDRSPARGKGEYGSICMPCKQKNGYGGFYRQVIYKRW